PGLFLSDRATVEAAQKLAEVEAPPPHADDQRHQSEQRRQAPAPGQVGAHGHSGCANAKGLAYPSAQAAKGGQHYGRTGGARRPVVSGRPNIRFMFCTAWPAAPLTRLSSTARITTVSPPCGRCTAIRQMFDA